MSNNQPKETLKFKVGLSGTHWDKIPMYSILIDDVEYASGAVHENSGQVVYAEFSCDLTEDADHRLQIRFSNKTDDQVVKEPPTGSDYKIVKDMLLNIESIEIDDLDIGQLKWSNSVFVPDNSRHPTLDNCVNLGWNGTYALNFRSPFYLWLLENS